MIVAVVVLAVVAVVLGALVVHLVGRVVELATMLASRSPIEAAHAKRIAAAVPMRRQNGGDADDQQLDPLTLGV